MQAVSAGTLVPLEDGKFTILEKDKKIPEIWESIIAKCETFTTVVVTDEERIAFEVVEYFQRPAGVFCHFFHYGTNVNVACTSETWLFGTMISI